MKPGQRGVYAIGPSDLLLAAKALARRGGRGLGPVVLELVEAWVRAHPGYRAAGGDLARLARLPEASDRGKCRKR